jgi:DNA polymerase I - 3''-5'' exonuclease and polymerase domains
MTALIREGLEVKKEFSPPGGWDNATWSEEMEEYAEHDALQTHRLYESVWSRMQSDSKAMRHYLEVEVPYQEVVLHMEANGMPLDLEKLDRVHSHLSKKVAGLRSVMQRIAGYIPTPSKEYSNKTLRWGWPGDDDL